MIDAFFLVRRAERVESERENRDELDAFQTRRAVGIDAFLREFMRNAVKIR